MLEQMKTPEQFLSKEEITTVFETILQGKPYKELRVLSDDEGVYLYEIEVTLENGERAEYNYQKAKNDYRKPSLSATARFSASVHKIMYDIEGTPYTGECAANYIDGIWSYTS